MATELCKSCHLPHRPLPTPSLFPDLAPHLCIGAMQGAMEHLLANVGKLDNCRGCGDPIYWVTHRNGKKTPYTRAGLNHFIDCIARDQFKEKSA